MVWRSRATAFDFDANRLVDNRKNIREYLAKISKTRDNREFGEKRYAFT